MKNLKRLGLSFTLMSFLVVAAFAGETPTMPCPPGEMSAPPCSGGSLTDSTPGEVLTPPSSTAGDLLYSAEAALWSVLLF